MVPCLRDWGERARHEPSGRPVGGLIGLAALLALSAAVPAAAAVTAFSDRATFLAATGSSGATGDLPNLGRWGSSHTAGSVSYTTGSGALGVGGCAVVGDWTALLPVTWPSTASNT